MAARAARDNSDDEILHDILFSSSDSEEENDNHDDSTSPDTRQRGNYARSAKRAKPDDPWAVNSWLQLIRHPHVSDPTKTQGREFRRKFRVPFPVFEDIVSKCKETDEPAFNYSEKDAVGQRSVPLELKVLAVLRMLADGLKFGTGSELANYMTLTTLNAFFKTFNSLFRKHYQGAFIKVPEGADLLRIMKDYIRLGLPGCVGSIDATFIPWERCSAILRNLCDGDKGVGLLYNVVVSHTREVLSVSNGFYSTISDKISVKYDEFIQLLKENEIGENVSYTILLPTDVEGEYEELDLSSFYVIADGGYLDIPQIIRGFEASGEKVKYKFSDWIASVRKDVECFFGILKMRFRFLKNPITLQNKVDLDNAFVTCCIINNMILRHDGLNTLWEDGVNWRTLNPAGEDIPEDLEADPVYHPVVHDTDTFVPVRVADLIPVAEIQSCHREKKEFEKLRLMLANHLQIMYNTGHLRWPKMRSEIEPRFNQRPRREFAGAGDLDDTM